MSLSADTSLIVSSYRKHDLLTDYLNKVQHYHPETEIIVVDVEPQGKRVKHVPRTIFTGPSNYSETINRGLQVATRQYLVWGNEDIRVDGPFIDPLVQPLTEDPRLLVGVGATKQCGWKFIVGWLVAMHRDALQDIGFLDEDFPGTFEDVDYSVRAQKAGYKLYKFGRGVIPVAHLSLGRLNRHLHTGKRLLLEKHGRPDS